MDENNKTDFQEAMRQIRNVILTRDANTDFKYSSPKNDVNADVKNGMNKVVTFIPDAGGSIVINGKCFFIKISLISGISDTKIGLKSGNLFTDFLQYTGNFKRCISV